MKGRCKMNKAMQLAALAGMVSLHSAAANCYYLVNGVGTWADASRWSGGNVPKSDDVVLITNGTARVTSADLDVLRRVYAIMVSGNGDVLEFNLDEDYRHPTRIIGNGKIVKNGTGALYLDANFSKQLNVANGMEVNGGELHLVEVETTDSHEFVYGPLTVNSPAKLFLRPGGSSYTSGISGDGVITNTSATARELYLITNTVATAGRSYSFSGEVSPNVDLTFKGVERQDMLYDNPYAITVRASAGTIGVAKFGASGGSSGGLGTTVNIWVNATGEMDPVRFLYLGEGETTSKSFRMNTSPRGVVFDGGAVGGLNLTGDFYLTRNLGGKMTQLILDGSNTTTCTFAGKALEYTSSSSAATHLVKRGTGTWRMTQVGGSELRGGVTIEKGTLEAETVAAAGSLCSLGKATVLQSAYWGAQDASKNVPWAIRLGDGSMPADLASAGTLSYVGDSADADCSTRPIALDGAGRLRNASSRSLAWTGVTSSGEGAHALVLDGDGTSNFVYDLTNGVGMITVVKEGAGVWTLDRNLDVSGFDVRGGTLDVRIAQKYSYYRFNVMGIWGDGEAAFMVSRIALFDADGNCRNLDLSRNAAADGSLAALQPGQFAFWTATSDYREGRPLERVFKENPEGATDADICTVSRSDGTVPNPDDESTWIRFAMRPVAGAAITRYDVCGCSVNGSNGKPYKREIKTWSLEGSVDGVTWDMLSAVTNNPNASSTKLLWYSSATSAYTSGYAISSEGSVFAKPSHVDMVSVSSNGTLRVDSPVEARGVRCDVASGGGRVEGFSFPPGGDLWVTGVGSGMAVLPIVFADCTGVENLAGWTLHVNGRATTSRSIGVGPDGRVCVSGCGISVIVR